MNRNVIYLALIALIVIVYKGLNMHDVTNLARTIWGEARGEGREGMIAVANTVMNRVGAGKWFSGTVSQVVTRPQQFSVWNKNDPNYLLITHANDKTPRFLEALEIAALAMRGQLVDRTGGATHYHSVSVKPAWADPSKVTARIGSHIFYKGIA